MAESVKVFKRHYVTQTHRAPGPVLGALYHWTYLIFKPTLPHGPTSSHFQSSKLRPDEGGWPAQGHTPGSAKARIPAQGKWIPAPCFLSLSWGRLWEITIIRPELLTYKYGKFTGFQTEVPHVQHLIIRGHVTSWREISFLDRVELWSLLTYH